MMREQRLAHGHRGGFSAILPVMPPRHLLRICQDRRDRREITRSDGEHQGSQGMAALMRCQSEAKLPVAEVPADWKAWV